MSARLPVEPSSPRSHFRSPYLNLFPDSLDVPDESSRSVRFVRGNCMEQITLSIVAFLLAFMTSPAMATPIETQTTAITTVQVSASGASAIAEPTPAQGVQPKDAGKDCDGQPPSTLSVTTVLSRIVRSSNITRGVQCPIPPVPDQSTTQEMRP